MSHEEITKLHQAIKDLKESNDIQFKDLNRKVDPMYQAFTTVLQGSGWIKYIFWFMGALIGLYLSLREVLKK